MTDPMDRLRERLARAHASREEGPDAWGGSDPSSPTVAELCATIGTALGAALAIVDRLAGEDQ